MGTGKIVNESKLKLILFESEINIGEFTHFYSLNKHFNICFINEKKNDKVLFVKYLDILIDESEVHLISVQQI